MLVGLGLLSPLPSPAQVLARPGWAGSGVALESWWVRAVFYRVDPARFQDSDGDGRGDLPGIVQRLDYLQSLGVDAVLLDGSLDSKDLDALGDLVREASRHQLRVLVTAHAEPTQASQAALLNTMRTWLAAGAAGVWVPRPPGSGLSDENYAGLVSAARSIVQSFPGDRVLLADRSPVALSLAPRPVRLNRHIDPGNFHAARNGQLITSAIFAVQQAHAPQLRGSLSSAAEVTEAGPDPLLRFADPPSTGSTDAASGAALLLASRGAVIVDFGEEIGLNLYPRTSASTADSASGLLPVMQWTPSNHTAAPPEQADAKAGAHAPEPEFGTYHPYVPPPRGLVTPAPAPVRVAPDLNIPAALPNADTLPGFTSGAPPTAPESSAKRNAIVEDRDPRSLLNAYRQLIALHHGNATLRNGAQAVLNRDSEDTVVWVRRAPAGSRTVANVVAAANLSERPVTLSLDSDLEGAGLRPGALRPLFSSVPEATTGETTARLILPPHSAFVGEIYRSGAIAEPIAHERHAGRRHSRHRVRR